MPRFNIRHVTRFSYHEPVRDSANQIMLYPIRDEYQETIQHTLTISGNPPLSTYVDHYGNEVGTFTHPFPHIELVIDSNLTIVTRARTIPEDSMPAASQWQQLDKLGGDLSFIDFLRPEAFKHHTDVQKLITAAACRERTPLQVVRNFSDYVYKNFKYQKGITTVETTLDEIWELKTGVCQDFAHMLLYILRAVGIPSRYVSGYICPRTTELRGEGATHAWVESYIPELGWIGIDPTNARIADDAYVRLAIGKNFNDCSPVKGTYRGTSGHLLDVTVTVQYDDGRVRKDHSEAEEPASEPAKSFAKNSFRRFQEMQIQQ
jgi:transglutaminase-like putative cysteine protease